MGRNQARILKEHPDYDLVAVCDLVRDVAEAAAGDLGLRAYDDLDAMMQAEQPAVVAIPTTSAAHAPLTLKVAPYPSVRGIYCEKPMATNMKDARAMNQACKDHGVLLVINHQRRIGPDLIKAKELIDNGAIGDVRVVRGCCAGDFLSGGTHVADSLLFLVGDPAVEWVVGQVVRDLEAIRAELERFGDYQGHAIESGAMAVAQLANGVRAEFFTGDMRPDGRPYQDYVIEGTRGQIWRLSDSVKTHRLFIANGEGGGTHVQDESLKGVSAPDGHGFWRPVDYEQPESRSQIPYGYALLAKSLREGCPHPMNGDIAINAFQIAMGLFESARTGRRIHAPVECDRFPLDVMIEEGRG